MWLGGGVWRGGGGEVEVARWAWPRWRAHRIAAAARGGEPMATKARAAYWGGVAGGMAGQAWGGGTWTLRCSLRVCVCVCVRHGTSRRRERESSEEGATALLSPYGRERASDRWPGAAMLIERTETRVSRAARVH